MWYNNTEVDPFIVQRGGGEFFKIYLYDIKIINHIFYEGFVSCEILLPVICLAYNNISTI